MNYIDCVMTAASAAADRRRSERVCLMRGFYPLISDLPLFNWAGLGHCEGRPSLTVARAEKLISIHGKWDNDVAVDRKFKLLTVVGRVGRLRGAAEDAAVRGEVPGRPLFLQHGDGGVVHISDLLQRVPSSVARW